MLTDLVVIGEIDSSEKREMLALGETPNLSQASGVRRADGCSAGAGWPSEEQVENPLRQGVAADLIAVAGHSTCAAPNPS
jgi:hypothetical protein